jgi:hypothetical protein
LFVTYKNDLRPWTNTTYPANLTESEARPLAPTRVHKRASSLAMFSMLATLGEAPLKTQLFLCFHIPQAPRMISEFIPFYTSPVTTAATLSHHESKGESLTTGAS